MRQGRFWRDQSAAVAAIYAIALPGLILVGGVAFDYTRLVGMDTELQNGADQAALAGATQLDKGDGACARAGNAAIAMLQNVTLLSATGNEVKFNGGKTITVASDKCNGFAPTDPDAPFTVRFFKTYIAQGDPDNEAADSDEEARYIEVRADEETTRYSFTPVAPLLRTLTARAVASIGGAICGTAAIYYCNPDLPASFDPDLYKGRGVMMGTNSGPGSWGYLLFPPDYKKEVTDTALAQDNPELNCVGTDQSLKAEPGSESGIIRAINTRFDLFNNNIVNPNQPCATKTDCGPAVNVLKDLVKQDSKKDWVFPDKQFNPAARSGTYNAASHYDADGLIDAMGLPRDLCHYKGYASACAGTTTDTLGDGNWARADYFDKYHKDRAPPNVNSITRYETYQWEIKNNYHAAIDGSAAGGSLKQRSRPVDIPASASAFDRRVLSVAFTRGSGGTCPKANDPLNNVTAWVDVFFVEPADRKRANYTFNPNSSDPVYVEIIGRSQNAGNRQMTQRDKPYLVE